MTRDEFEKKLFEFSNAAAASWRIDTTKQYKASRESILAEHDRLTAELKELNEQLDVQVEFTNDQTEEIGDLQYQISQLREELGEQ